jgi:2-C-methyl-D-erythritol 2,4-cyclodiphosphate synthase|tara:strand:- start:480 stop:947 length:468 start_codon:yes stop_codon:yes gene_type:complete
MRIGQGFDAHCFTDGNEIILGGVIIPHSFAIEAHSDGDVLLHAICDALLGAAGLGDIGKHYSDQDNEHKNRNSREFVVDVLNKLHEQNLTVVNVDATVILQSPKIAIYIDEMRQIIATDLKLEATAVNVKATTTERMGFIGREEGIAAMAVVLLK